MLENLFRPVAALALTLGLAGVALAAEPLKVGTTAAFAIPLEAAVCLLYTSDAADDLLTV